MIIRSLSTFLAGLCMALWASVAAAQTPAAEQPAPGVVGIGDSSSSAYVLGRDDVVAVGLLGRTDFGGRARVQADGTIQLNFIGKIQAADRTTAELAEAVASALKTGGYFADPVVTVEVVGYASRYVTILGAVGSPGLVPINRPYRMSEILARVGGVRDNAADYLQVRHANGEETRLALRDLATGDASADPYVQAGDKIYAPTAETFYIYGQVRSPGQMQLSTGMTMRMALAKAGGLTESGSDKKIDVTREGKKTKVKLDDPVQPGDVIVVGERLF